MAFELPPSGNQPIVAVKKFERGVKTSKDQNYVH